MTTKLKPIPPLRAKFLEAAEQRRLSVSANARKAYAKWVREFIQFHHPRKVESLGPSERLLVPRKNQIHRGF